MSLKVLIIDDHEAARLGLTMLLRGSGFFVKGAVSTGGEATALVQKDHFDIVLLDVRMPERDGLATLESIRESDDELPIVILTAYDNPTYIARAAALGASEYVLKSGSSQIMTQTLERVARAEAPPADSPLVKVRRVMAEEVDVSSLPPEFPLTSREAQVLRHVALGLSNKEIARSLAISVETVKEHVQNILRKTGAHDRTDAAVRAIKSGIVD